MNMIKPSRMTTSITLFLLNIFPFSRLCGAIYQNYGDLLIFIRFLSIPTSTVIPGDEGDPDSINTAAKYCRKRKESALI